MISLLGDGSILSTGLSNSYGQSSSVNNVGSGVGDIGHFVYLSQCSTTHCQNKRRQNPWIKMFCGRSNPVTYSNDKSELFLTFFFWFCLVNNWINDVLNRSLTQQCKQMKCGKIEILFLCWTETAVLWWEFDLLNTFSGLSI